jgi:glutamyl-tRNA reductase
VYDIDDLKGIIDENIEDRHKEAIKGERIVDEAVIRFREWYESLDVVPTIIALRKKMTAIAEAELKKTLQASMISEQEAKAVRRMAESLINKILHDPTRFLKRNGMLEDKSFYIDSVRKLFNLDE